MSDIGLNFASLYTALGIGLLAGLLVPLLGWWLLARLGRPRRTLLAGVLAFGVAGIAGAIASFQMRDAEVAIFAVFFAFFPQLLVLPALLFFTRKA